jgi:hypothetical protein
MDTIYIYYMTSRVIYQNIFPQVTGKPWSVMSPDAEGRGDITLQGFLVTKGKIFW